MSVVNLAISEQNSSMRILCIDSSSLVRVMCRSALDASFGKKIHLVECDSADEALMRLAIEPFDLVLIDYFLADQTAIEFLHQLRHTAATRPAVIVLTYRAEKSFAQDALSEGAWAYLIKDSDEDFAESLCQTVERVMRDFNVDREISALTSRPEFIPQVIGDPAVAVDENGCIVYANYRAADLFGLNLAEMRGAALADFLFREETDASVEWSHSIICRALRDNRHANVKDAFLWGNAGRSRAISYYCAPVRIENMERPISLIAFKDVTETSIPASVDPHSLLAKINASTGQQSFDEVLTLALRRATRSSTLLAVAVIDIDVADSTCMNLEAKGRNWSTMVAERIRECIRINDSVFALEKNQFGVIIENLRSMDEAAVVADKMIGAIAQSFRVDDTEVWMMPTLGICVYPNQAQSQDSMLECALTALSYALNHNAPGYAFAE